MEKPKLYELWYLWQAKRIFKGGGILLTEDAVKELRNKHPGKYTEGYIRQFDKEWTAAVKTLRLSGQNLARIYLVPKH